MPTRLVPDNLKTAVVLARFGGDPVIQRSYRECAEHYGFRIAPTPPRSPQHKGKVEQGGARTVEISTTEHDLRATHDPPTVPGKRQTPLNHPPPGKVSGIILSRDGCRQQSAAIGPATTVLVEQLLVLRPEDRLRSAGRVLLLAASYSPERLEQACARAQHFGEADYPIVNRIPAGGSRRHRSPPPTCGRPVSS